MQSPRRRFMIAASVVVVAVLGLVVFSLTAGTAYYRTPAELLASTATSHQTVRVAGKVVDGTVVRNGAITNFTVTDGKASVPVTTGALLPDTFGAGVTVVAEGSMVNGVFSASGVLAKCPSKFQAKVPA